jgi:hypothetical protein
VFDDPTIVTALTSSGAFLSPIFALYCPTLDTRSAYRRREKGKEKGKKGREEKSGGNKERLISDFRFFKW